MGRREQANAVSCETPCVGGKRQVAGTAWRGGMVYSWAGASCTNAKEIRFHLVTNKGFMTFQNVSLFSYISLVALRKAELRRVYQRQTI